MKKMLLIAFLLIIQFSFAEISFSGLNEFEYINANKITENKNYFSDKIQMQIQYDNFNAGIEYNVYYPKFDETSTSIEENEKYFQEYYLQYEGDYWFAQAGTFEAVIGSGIVLHNFYDADFEEDSRLIGGYVNPIYDRWQLQLFGGYMESLQFEDDYDQLGAADLDLDIGFGVNIGGSYILHKELIAEDDFRNRNITAGKLSYSSNLFDLNSEYAVSSRDDDLDGSAIYTNLTSYIGKFTLIGGYKNYENFNVRISDLPMVNHSGQLLEHDWEPGKDEEGLMGEIRFLPNYENEFVVNYAEGWSHDFKVRMSNFYSEFIHEFENWSFKAEFEDLEQLNEATFNRWYKEITPTLTFDLLVKDNPVMIKAEYQYKKEDRLSGSHSHYEPRLQMDIGWNNYSISVAAEQQIGESEMDDAGDDGDIWIGGEIAVSMPDKEVNLPGFAGNILNTIVQNSDLRLFAGKEKGGIICRNGVCKNQAEFEGVRLNLTTTF